MVTDRDLSSILTSFPYHKQEQLNSLMETLNKTEPHYIRCIKPNSVKRPASEVFEGMNVLRQLRYAGVFEAVEIRQTGYPFRMTHEQVWLAND